MQDYLGRKERSGQFWLRRGMGNVKKGFGAEVVFELGLETYIANVSQASPLCTN